MYIKAAKTVRLARKEALIGRRELLETGAVAFKVYVPGVEEAGHVSFEVSNAVRAVLKHHSSPYYKRSIFLLHSFMEKCLEFFRVYECSK